MQRITDPYRALGLGRGATDADIKTAHRKLAKRYHPDGETGDTSRFLGVQEAYRVLSDPLLRREWDARHAPGPVRADRVERPERPVRQPRPARKAAPQSEAAASAPPDPESQGDPVDPRTAPRSRRAYTWSAAEVPWWEEASTRADRRQPGRRRPRTAPESQPGTDPNEPRATPTDEPAFNPTQDFDVYNRSSGAAWSMAARAYFRRGDQDLPRRGSFHHQGALPLTAARARTAAEAEARRRAAAASQAASPPTARRPAGPSAPPKAPASADPHAPAGAFSAGQPETTRQPRATEVREATRVREATEVREATRGRDPREGPRRIVRRSRPAPWPSLTQRLIFALIAWLPLVALLSYAGSVAQDEEVGLVAVIAITLAVLVAVPRLAYVGSVATLGLLVIGGVFIGALAILNVPLPLSMGLTAAIGAALMLGYIATAGMVALGPSSLRPWAACQPQTVRNR